MGIDLSNMLHGFVKIVPGICKLASAEEYLLGTIDPKMSHLLVRFTQT